MLRERDFVPQRQFGQCFLIDLNLMAKVLELADLKGDETVLEVGPGTGSLTEELLSRAKRVVTVEIDRGLCQLLRENFADRPNFTLICGDVLAGKHAISPEVIAALGEGSVNLISNLPYNVATPLIAECLVSTWRRVVGGDSLTCRFERLTFTVQREVADRLAACPGNAEYGPVSVLVSLLGRVTAGPVLPPTAFWPIPNVASRIMRIDFDDARAGQLVSVDRLQAVLNMVFGQRRKQIGSIMKRKGAKLSDSSTSPGAVSLSNRDLESALAKAGIDPVLRAEVLMPEQFRFLTNALAGR